MVRNESIEGIVSVLSRSHDRLDPVRDVSDDVDRGKVISKGSRRQGEQEGRTRARRKFDRGGTRSDIYFSSTEKERLGRGSRGRNKGIAISLTAAPYITSAPLRLLLRSPLFIFPRARSSGPSSLLSIFERFTDNSQYASFHPHSVFQPRSFFFSFFFLFNPLASLASLALFLSSVSFPFFVLTLTRIPEEWLYSVDSKKGESLFSFYSFCLYVYIL